MKLKSILLKLEINGVGIVNFDSNDQKKLWKGIENHHLQASGLGNNYSYAKKNYYYDENGNITYKVKISSECLKQDIFKFDKIAESPKIASYDPILYSYIASPLGIVKGFMFPDVNCKRSGAINLIDAEQTNNAMSAIDIHTKSGEKIGRNAENVDKDTSLFNKESVGKITYLSTGGIDLMKMQFVSLDQVFDRQSFSPDKFDLFKSFLKMRMPSFDSELGYYKLKNSSIDIEEYGFMFSNEVIGELIRFVLKNILHLNITRASAYAQLNSFKVKLVYNPLTDLLEDDNNWIELKTEEDVDKLSIDYHEYYELVDLDDARQKRNDIDLAFKAKQNKKKAEKEDKTEKFKAAKLAKEQAKLDNSDNE